MADLDLLVVGDLNADVIVRDPDLAVEFGQVERLVSDARLTMGGSAAITAVGAARLGVSTGLCAVVGADAIGALLLAQLRDEGVDVGRVRIDHEISTGMSVILDRRGDRAILTSPGSIAGLVPEDLRAISRDDARHVHSSSYFLMNEALRAYLPEWLCQMREGGTRTSIDTNWDPELRWDIGPLLRCCDWYFPNEAELIASTGSPVLEASLGIIADLGTSVAVKRGSSGALARSGDTLYRLRQTPPVDFVDSVGAGDTFNAGFIAGLLDGAGVAASLAMAVTAGTLSTGGPGGVGAQPTRDLLDPLAQRLHVEQEPS